MPTVRDVITLAMKQARIIAPGEDINADEANDGLLLLQGLYDGWWTGGMFGQLEDVVLSASDEAAPFQRIQHPTAAAVTLPTTIDRDDGVLPAYDLSPIELFNTTTSTLTRSLFDATRGAWVNINALTLDSEAPLASRGMDGLAACLALSFAEMFGESLGPMTVRRAALFKTALSMKIGAARTHTEVAWF